MFDVGTSGTGTSMVLGILWVLALSAMVLSFSGGGGVLVDLSEVVGALNAIDGFCMCLFCFLLDILDLFEDLEDFPVRVRDLVAGGPG